MLYILGDILFTNGIKQSNQPFSLLIIEELIKKSLIIILYLCVEKSESTDNQNKETGTLHWSQGAMLAEKLCGAKEDLVQTIQFTCTVKLEV